MLLFNIILEQASKYLHNNRLCEYPSLMSTEDNTSIIISLSSPMLRRRWSAQYSKLLSIPELAHQTGNLVIQ